MRYSSFGESHGKCILATIDGFPAGFTVNSEKIDGELARRQGGYGRGSRQTIEHDHVEILSGVIRNVTTGGPLALMVVNRDHKIDQMPELTSPRPGHADLAGMMKYGNGIRPILERASARETVARVAAGALVRQLLEHHGIKLAAFVTAIGPVSLDRTGNVSPAATDSLNSPNSLTVAEIMSLRSQSIVYSLCPDRDDEVKSLIDMTAAAGDTLGGTVEVRVTGLPFGLGSHTQWDKRLDGRLAQAIMSIQAIKGVEIGGGFQSARQLGSQSHDPILYDTALKTAVCRGYVRPTNHAGGLEGGMTNTQPLVLRAAMKPIPTLKNALPSVNTETKEPVCASFERSDVCAVPACSVVVENAVALTLAEAFLETYGADRLSIR